MADSSVRILFMVLVTATFLGATTAVGPNGTILCYRCVDSHDAGYYKDKKDPKCVSGMMDDSYLTEEEGDPPGSTVDERKKAKQGTEREMCETSHTTNRENKKTITILRRKVISDESLGCRKGGDFYSLAEICTCNTDKCNKDPIKPSAGGVSQRRVTAALMILTACSTYLLNNRDKVLAA